MPTFADRGSHVVSVTDPYGSILCFLDRSVIIIATRLDLKEIICEVVDWIKFAQDMFVIMTHLHYRINQLRDYQLIKNGPAPWR
jgi:hypothetical protein